MEAISFENRLSASSRNALDWAFTWASNRKGAQIGPLDLLVGTILSHGEQSQPLQLLRHYRIPESELYRRLRFDPSQLPPRPDKFPGTSALAQESMKVIELALSLGERYNEQEGGLVRLRDLFGALLLEQTPARRAYEEVVREGPVSIEELIKIYNEYLSEPGQPSLPRFLQERHPAPDEGREGERPPRFISQAVSGFSADTRANRDLVGIGAEVDAFAYLIAARALKPPLAIGLFGDWGSGKTYFMQSLQERIFHITEDARLSGRPQKDLSVYKYIVQIEFNAWHYVEGELWASLVEHILHNLQTRPGESPTLLQLRQQRVIEQMENLRREQSLAREQKESLEGVLKDKQNQIKEIEKERDRKLSELEELRGKDVLEAVTLTEDDRRELNSVLKDVGVAGAYDSALEFMDALDRLKFELERSSSLAMLMRRRGLSWTLGLAAVILSGPLISAAISLLSQNQVPAVTNALLSLSGFLAGLTALLRGGTAEISKMLNRVDAARAKLDDKRKQAEAAFEEQIAQLQRELDQTQEAYDQAVKEEQELANQIQALEQELEQITPRRVLLDFIQERVESQDYRKWLGVAALIRRDFDQLSQLIHQQNRDFIKRDDGSEKEEDRDLINRIVLYIDDLDRCPPERVAEVLQAVHLLLAFPLFVVVVAVDSRWLSQSLQTHYNGLLAAENGDQQERDGSAPRATPQDYLEKIFQIPFWVRPLGETARMRIVQGLVEKSLVDKDGKTRLQREDEEEFLLPGESGGQPADQVETPSRVEWSPGELAQEYDPEAKTETNPPSLDILDVELSFMEALGPLLGLTPRSVKRFVNVYWLIKSIALGQSEDFINDEPYAGFKRVQFLLAVLTGMPAISHEFFALLCGGVSTNPDVAALPILGEETPLHPTDPLSMAIQKLRDSAMRRRDGGEDVEDAWRELDRLEAWAKRYAKGSWTQLPVSELRAWAPLVARFSYRMEEV